MQEASSPFNQTRETSKWNRKNFFIFFHQAILKKGRESHWHEALILCRSFIFVRQVSLSASSSHCRTRHVPLVRSRPHNGPMPVIWAAMHIYVYRRTYRHILHIVNHLAVCPCPGAVFACRTGQLAAQVSKNIQQTETTKQTDQVTSCVQTFQTRTHTNDKQTIGLK